MMMMTSLMMTMMRTMMTLVNMMMTYLIYWAYLCRKNMWSAETCFPNKYNIFHINLDDNNNTVCPVIEHS